MDPGASEPRAVDAPRLDWGWIEPARWDALVAASPGATVFHTRGWMEVLGDWDGRYRAAALGTELADGTALVLPLLVRRGVLRRGRLARGVSSFPNVYGGPLGEGRLLDTHDWDQLWASLDALPLGILDCQGNLIQPLAGRVPDGVRVRERTTHVIDLGSLPERARDSYRPACKRAVARAEREGVVCEHVVDHDVLAEYHAVYRDSLRRWGEEPGEGYPLELFEQLVAQPGVELWCARVPDGRIAAGGLFGFQGRHADYWQGAMLSELSETRASNALHDVLIESARARGCALYDFNPSDDLPGVERFKQTFGARRAAYSIWRWRRPWLGAST